MPSSSGQAEEARRERSRPRADQFARPRPLDPDVVAAAVARRGFRPTTRGMTIASPGPAAIRRTVPPVASAMRAQLLGRRDDILHLERILLADIDQRDMLAVLGAIEAEPAHRHVRAAEAGRVGRQSRAWSSCRPERRDRCPAPSPLTLCRSTVTSRPLALARRASSSRSGSFISQCARRRRRSR